MKASEVLEFKNLYIGKRFRLVESYNKTFSGDLVTSNRNEGLTGEVFIAVGIMPDEYGGCIVGVKLDDYQDRKDYASLYYEAQDFYELCDLYEVDDYASVLPHDEIECRPVSSSLGFG